MQEIVVIAFIVFIIILLLYHYSASEHLLSPGYSNRQDVEVHLDKTYGGSDAQFKKDPRFGI